MMCVKGLEKIKFKLSYNSSLLNVWTGNAAVLAGLTESAETAIPASLGILQITYQSLSLCVLCLLVYICLYIIDVVAWCSG